MKIGFHISIAGGFKNVVARARERSCQTMQFFSRNPRTWKYRALDKTDVSKYRKALRKTDIKPVFIHMPYLVNLASPDSALYARSLDSLIIELRRAAELNAHYVIMHIGSAENEKKGIKSFITGINKALHKVNNKIILLLENTPKSGHEMGYDFEQINTILKDINEPRRIGVVFDTAHAFAAGYPLHTKKGVASTLKQFHETIGIDRLHLIHFNDSKTALGSCHDRHWHIGRGNIGAGMGYFINHPLLQEKPFIMETPRKDVQDDLINLSAVKKFLKTKKYRDISLDHG
jgi:deoxyribonuclease-4